MSYALTEKNIVLDVLGTLKSTASSYSKMILECGDMALRSEFQKQRDETEKAQYEVYKFAEKKGYYIPSATDTPMQVQQLKANLTEALSAKKQVECCTTC